MTIAPQDHPARRSFLLGTGAVALGGCTTIAPTQFKTPRKVLWAANVRSKSLTERLLAAQLGGFTHMSVFPIDYRGWRAQGMSGPQIRQQIRSAGIRVLAVDPFVQWVPGFTIPSGYPADYRSFIEFNEAQILEMAQELEAEAINCVEGLNQAYPLNSLVDAFGRFADRAQSRGLRVTLEFMPISSIKDLGSGWAIVQAAGRSNAGLCFDTWHYFRSTPNEALLQTIPGHRIFEVQLADATLALKGRDLTEDLLRFRRLPGEGEFPLGQVVSVLKRTGAWQSVGPEVFADAMDALTAQEAGRQAGRSLAQWL